MREMMHNRMQAGRSLRLCTFCHCVAFILSISLSPGVKFIRHIKYETINVVFRIIAYIYSMINRQNYMMFFV